MSTRPKILLLGEIDHAHEQWSALNEIGDLVKPQSTNRKDFIQECKSGKLDGVVAAYRTFGSVSITGLIDEELVNALPHSWRYLAHYGAGYDQIVPEACSKRDPPLRVSNTPAVTDDATADTAMFLILGALRNFGTSMMALRRGEFRGQPQAALGHDPQGKTLGILGMGGIGRNLKRRADVFGMKTIYHNRRELDSELAAGATYVTLDGLLKSSDVLSLNLPLNDETRHIISTEQFERMKPTTIVINTARGSVIDESALVEALDRGLIAGAGLDVYEAEPQVHPGLIRNEKVMLLPHMGTWTSETQKKMECCAMDNIRSALTGNGLLNMIGEQKKLGLNNHT